jgi:hypothetical protein
MGALYTVGDGPRAGVSPTQHKDADRQPPEVSTPRAALSAAEALDTPTLGPLSPLLCSPGSPVMLPASQTLPHTTLGEAHRPKWPPHAANQSDSGNLTCMHMLCCSSRTPTMPL